MASKITVTGVSIVCSTICSGADQREHQSSASLAVVRGIRRWPGDSVKRFNVSISWRHQMHCICKGVHCIWPSPLGDWHSTSHSQGRLLILRDETKHLQDLSKALRIKEEDAYPAMKHEEYFLQNTVPQLDRLDRSLERLKAKLETLVSGKITKDNGPKEFNHKIDSSSLLCL